VALEFESSEDKQGTEPMVIASCSLAVVLALVAGVGGATGLVWRHVIQTFPFWFAIGLGFRRSSVTGWIAVPCFLFWLVLMTFIWLYLLGVARIVSGHFAPIEIVMTIIVGIACLIGIVSFVRFKSRVRPWAAIVLFVLFAAGQWGCFLLSVTPRFANR
jgi:cation transport ATPase